MQNMLRVVLLAVCCCPWFVQAEDHSSHNHNHADQQSSLMITNAWAKATIPGIKVSSGYMTLTNHSHKAIRLVAAKTPMAQHVEYHTMSVKNNKMVMRMIDDIEIPAHETVMFAPNGYHLMFVSLNERFIEGEQFPLTLIADNGAEYAVSMLVKGLEGHAAEHDHSHSDSHSESHTHSH